MIEDSFDNSNKGVPKVEVLKPYIDKEGKIEKILEQLEKGKLVFIVGLQGVGKSRTAYEVACLSERFALALVYGKDDISLKICESGGKIRNIIIEVGFSKWEDIQTLLITAKTLRYIHDPQKFLKKIIKTTQSIESSAHRKEVLGESVEDIVLEFLNMIAVSPATRVLLSFFWPYIKDRVVHTIQERDVTFNIEYHFRQAIQKIKKIFDDDSTSYKEIEENLKQLASYLSSKGLLLIIDRAIAERHRSSDNDKFKMLVKGISESLKDIPDVSMIVVHTVPPGSLVRREKIEEYINLLKRDEETIELLREYYGDKLGNFELKDPNDVFVIEPPRDLTIFKEIVEVNTGKKVKDIQQLYKVSAGLPAIAIALVLGNIDLSIIQPERSLYEFKTYDELRKLIDDCQEKFRLDEYEKCLERLKESIGGIKWTIDSSLFRLLRNLAISSLIAGHPYPVINVIDLDKDPFQRLRENIRISKNECLRLLKSLKEENKENKDVSWDSVDNEICNINKMYVDEYVPMIVHKNERHEFRTYGERWSDVEIYTLSSHGEWIVNYLRSLGIHHPLWILPIISGRLMLRAFYDLYKKEFEIPEDYIRHVQKTLLLLIRTRTWKGLEKEVLTLIRDGLIVIPSEEIGRLDDYVANFLDELRELKCLQEPFVYTMITSEFIRYLGIENTTRTIRSTIRCLKSVRWEEISDAEKMYVISSLTRMYSVSISKEVSNTVNELLTLSQQIYNTINDNDIKSFTLANLAYLELMKDDKYNYVSELCKLLANKMTLTERLKRAARKANQEIEEKYGIAANPERSVIDQYTNIVRDCRHYVLRSKGLDEFCKGIETYKLNIPEDLHNYVNLDDHLSFIMYNGLAEIVCALNNFDLERVGRIIESIIRTGDDYQSIIDLLFNYDIEGLEYLLLFISLTKFLEKMTNDKRYQSITIKVLDEVKRVLKLTDEVTEEELIVAILNSLSKIDTKAYFTSLSSISLGYLALSGKNNLSILPEYLKETLNQINDSKLQQQIGIIETDSFVIIKYLFSEKHQELRNLLEELIQGYSSNQTLRTILEKIQTCTETLGRRDHEGGSEDLKRLLTYIWLLILYPKL